MRATEKQIDFLHRLRGEREFDPAPAQRLATMLRNHEDPDNPFEITAADATTYIDWLVAQPLKGGSSQLDLRTLDSGRYAVLDVLVKVDNLTDDQGGKWQGWVFVKNGSEYVDETFGRQAPGQTYAGSHADILEAILADPAGALAHYGHITGHCGVCGRKLEDEVSVARGIGPVCFSKLA
jgi:hypothetical protein